MKVYLTVTHLSHVKPERERAMYSNDDICINKLLASTKM
jgi:hypothetical protein